jgi:hypothetical protein
MIRRLLLLLLALTAGGLRLDGANSPPAPPFPPPEMQGPVYPVYRFQRGDDPRWAARDFDDSAWQEIPTRELPSRDGIYWVRWRVKQRNPALAHARDGLLIKVVASYDLYWDGKLIGRNGRPSSDPDDEHPGDVDALFQIPQELLGPGEHVVALRLSSYHTGFPGSTYALLVGWGNFRTMLVERSRTALFSVMAVGAALIAAVVFGLMWLLAGRRLPLLLLSALFLCVAFMQALQAWRWLFEYPYSWHYPRLVVITALTTAMAALLPAFVLHHFAVGRPRWMYGVLAVTLTASWFVSSYYNLIGLLACTVGFSVAFWLSCVAAWTGRRGAWFACGGLAASVFALITAPRDFLDHAFFISAGPAVLGLLIAVVLELRDERRAAQQAVLTAARLETELLKKNIQPHFLINTLATIQEVIEQDPRAAVALIDALASEFRILNRVSGEQLIPLGQEIELCHAHLRVMSLRKGAACALRVSGVDAAELVPPALFHTLIENGLTHLMPRDGRLEFELRAEHRGRATRYILLARGQRQGSEMAPKEGTGLRYIKARLDESFHGHWTLTGGPVLEGWETVIEIVRGAADARDRRSVTRREPGTFQRTEEPA